MAVGVMADVAEVARLEHRLELLTRITQTFIKQARDFDRLLARVLLDNLLGNAWKFTGRRSHAEIELGERIDDGKRVLFVRDNGAGFDSQAAARRFSPFQRMHGASEFPGTGVGLSNVQRIVRRHGGRIWAESAEDAGATLCFTLPPLSELS